MVSLRAGVLAGAALLGLGLFPHVAAAEFIVNGSQVAAERDSDGKLTAKVSLINPTDEALTLPTPTTTADSCTVEYAVQTLPPLATTSVTLALGPKCLPTDGSVSEITVDLDGAEGGRGPITVTSPSAPSDWWALAVGAVLGLVSALVVAALADNALYTARKSLIAKAGDHATRFEAFKERLCAWGATAPEVRFDFKELPQGDYDYGSPVERLEPGWKFGESWVSSVTVVTAGLVTVLTSTDLFSALLGAAPKPALSVMAVAGLISAFFIGVANATVKLVGKDVSKVTVGGLLLSSALITFAAILQVATITAAAAMSVTSSWVRAAFIVAGAVAASVALVLIHRTLGGLIRTGVPDPAPVIPPGSAEAWAWQEPWQKEILADELAQQYSSWMTREGVATSDVGWAPDSYPAVYLGRYLTSPGDSRASML